jgi:sulfate transport system substrate-binding protein
LIENPVTLIDKNVDKHGVREAAEAFVTFLWTHEAQRDYAKYGLRPIVPTAIGGEALAQFPSVEDLWKVEYLGGWKKVTNEFYGPNGIYQKITEELQRSR